MHSASYLVVIWLLFAVLVSAADLYKALEISRHASEQDIRKAYKRLSRKYHPDKNTDPGAEEKFVEIAHAYEVLSDPTKRQIYDRHGDEGLKAHEGGQQSHGNPFDIFSSFFGGGGFNAQQQVRRGPTVTLDFEVSLADMYKGANIDFLMNKKILCDHCRGSGAASDGDIHDCSGCGGSGVKTFKQQIFPGMFAQTQSTCNECGGRGRVIKKICPHCKGQKVVDHSQHYTLELQPGTPEGFGVMFEGEGDESPDWEAGDIILRVRSKKENGGLRRKESSLYWRETIGVDEALLGFKRNITQLDGRLIQIDYKGVTQPGYVQTVQGEGMPIYETDNFGDLFIEYNVVLPVELNLAIRQKLTEAFYGSRHHDRDEL